MYDIKNLDTHKLLYDPQKPKELDRLREDVPEFDAEISLGKNKVATYVVLLYDISSPLRVEYPKMLERKAIAAQYAGFTLDKHRNKFQAPVEKMITGQIPEINVMAIKYLRLFNDPHLIALESYVNMLAIISAQTLGMKEDADPRDATTRYALIDKLSTSIKELTNEVFKGREVDEIIRELYGSIESVKEMLMPEHIAQKLAAGEDFGYNPYGEYKPEPLELSIDEEQIFKADET